MGILILYGAIGVAVLLLSRLRVLREVVVAAALSSAAAGLSYATMLLLGFIEGVVFVSPLAETAFGVALMVTLVTIIPNLITLGAVRSWCRAQSLPGWDKEAALSSERSLWTAITTGVLVAPVGVAYGLLALLATVILWSAVIILSERAVVPGHLLTGLLGVPIVQGTAAVGGVVAIGVQGLRDRRAGAARTVRE